MHSDLLNSWKEIANYLGRGVRTVQRWEVQLRLPVRRAHMHRRSSVTALRSDIDQWVSKAGRSANGARFSVAAVRETTAILKINRQEMHALSTRMHDQVKQTYGLIQRACELASKNGAIDRAVASEALPQNGNGPELLR